MPSSSAWATNRWAYSGPERVSPKRVEAEAVVDALTEDAAGAVLTLQHHHVVDALLPEPDGGGQARRAARR